MASLNKSISAFVFEEPRVASEVYDHFAHSPRPSVKAAVSKLVRDHKLFRPRLNLAHNNSILSGTSDFADPRLLRKLYDNGFYGRGTIRSLLEHLQFTQPAVTLAEVAKIGAIRIGVGPGFDWKEAESLINGLEELAIVEKLEIRPCDFRWAISKDLFQRAHLRYTASNLYPAYLVTKELLRVSTIEALSKWLVQNRFVSPGGSHMVNAAQPAVSYAFQPFDYLGFCYANGVATRTRGQKLQPRPVVGDILFEVCSLPYAKSFKVRIDEATIVGHGLAPMAFIMAKGFQREAFEFLSKEGILLWATDQLLGKKTAESIEKTLKLCEVLVRKANLDPKLFLEAFSGFENFGGLFGNIKGKLFEIMMAYFVGKLGYESVQIGRSVPAVIDDGKDGNRYKSGVPDLDLDVYANLNSGALLMECKGLSEDVRVSSGEIEKHFSERTSRMRLFLLRAPQNTIKRFKSVFVTTGTISEEDRKAFDAGQFKCKADTTIELWDRNDLLNKFRESGQSELVEVLQRFFSNSKSADEASSKT